MLLQQQSPSPNLLRSCDEEFSETKTIIILQGVNFPATEKHHWILYCMSDDCLPENSAKKKKNNQEKSILDNDQLVKKICRI